MRRTVSLGACFVALQAFALDHPGMVASSGDGCRVIADGRPAVSIVVDPAVDAAVFAAAEDALPKDGRAPLEPQPDEPALSAKLVRLTNDMKGFAEAPRDLVIVDESGAPVRAGDHERRFFEASWLHFKDGRYHFTYSTGDTHLICEAVSETIEGPYVHRGVILEPQVGWTTHHCVTEVDGRWYLFHHDSVPSGGRTWLRSLKVKPL